MQAVRSHENNSSCSPQVNFPVLSLTLLPEQREEKTLFNEDIFVDRGFHFFFDHFYNILYIIINNVKG